MQISQNTGLAMVLFTTFLWGSWAQFVKKIGRWPIAAFMLWLYAAGFRSRFGFNAVLKEYLFPEGFCIFLGRCPKNVYSCLYAAQPLP